MKGNVYFARSGDLVKIGFTTDIATRLVQLQTGNPEAVEIIAVISDAPPQLERILHRYFAESRARGEWFNQSIPLQQLIAHVRGGARPMTANAITHYANLFPNEKLHGNPHVDVRLTAKQLLASGWLWPDIRSKLEWRGPGYVKACDSFERVLTRRKKSS